MAKAECRAVNGGGGYVNHCEQVLDDQNEVVLAAANVAVAAGGDLHKLPVSINGVYPSEAEFNSLKKFTVKNLEIMEELRNLMDQKNEEIKELNNKLNYVSDILEIMCFRCQKHLYETLCRNVCNFYRLYRQHSNWMMLIGSCLKWKPEKNPWMYCHSHQCRLRARLEWAI